MIFNMAMELKNGLMDPHIKDNTAKDANTVMGNSSGLMGLHIKETSRRI